MPRRYLSATRVIFQTITVYIYIYICMYIHIYLCQGLTVHRPNIRWTFHASAYVSIRQHTSAYVSIPMPGVDGPEAKEPLDISCVTGVRKGLCITHL
jgi:hypothetical protein